MGKFFKFILISLAFIFSGFIFVGLVMYVVYYLYTNYKKEIIIAFKKFPEIESGLRKIASFTSIELKEDEMSNLRTETLLEETPLKVNKKSKTQVLNSRQSKILKLLIDNKKLEMSDIKNNFPKINVRTLRRDLSTLESQALIVKVGKTKGAFYKLS